MLLQLALLLPGIPCSGQSTPNSQSQETTFIPFFHKKDQKLVHFQTFYKKDLDGNHTLLMIRGGREPLEPSNFFGETEDEWLGLFLVKPAEPDWVCELTMLPYSGSLDLVERAVEKSIVLHQNDHPYGFTRELKFFFSTQSGQVLKRFEYSSLPVEQILELNDQLYFVIGAPLDFKADIRQLKWWQHREKKIVARLDGDRLIVVSETERDSLLTRAKKERVPGRWNFTGHREFVEAPRQYRPFGAQGLFTATVVVSSRNRVFENVEGIAEKDGTGFKLYRLPKTTLEELAKADPLNDWTGLDYDPLAEEGIGPYQIVGNRFWFGKTFYHAEGFTGTGGFGYFDANERRYVLFRPPAIIPWSVSALLVEANNVWLGLVGRTEGAEYLAGLMRYDRDTGQVEKFQFIASGCASATRFCSYEVITQIKRQRDSLYLATHHGLLIFRNNQLTRYTFEPTINGRIEVHKITP